MILERDGAAASAGRSDGDVLVEGCCPHDGRLVDTLVLPDRVGPSVASERPLDSALGWGVQRVLYDIVLNQGIGGPAIDGEKTNSTSSTETTTECNRAMR